MPEIQLLEERKSEGQEVIAGIGHVERKDVDSITRFLMSAWVSEERSFKISHA